MPAQFKTQFSATDAAFDAVLACAAAIAADAEPEAVMAAEVRLILDADSWSFAEA
jgi:hypothetical protein